jgi:hypothetical protein
MEHFRQRIPVYYPGTIAVGDRDTLDRDAIVVCILDELSVCRSPRSIDEVWATVKSSLPLDDRALVVDLLRNLSQDHYLVSDEYKRYSFRFPLIQQWWKLAQGLSS